MKTLSTPVEASRWLHSRVRGTLQTDSRSVRPGDGFIAWPGAATDGRRYVAAALAQGADACLVEQSGVEAFGFEGDAIASYAGLKAATGPIAAAYFEAPTHGLDVLAVTGTNGKTSIAWWLAQALSNVKHPAPIPCGLVGTLGIGRPPRVEFNGLTTPDPVLLQKHFRRFVDEGLMACAIEASSIGLAERRLDGTRIRVALFSNLTQDHLDYHGSMEAYWQAKAELFRWPGLQAAVINVDDAHGARLVASLVDRAIDVWTVSCGADPAAPARLQARHIGYAVQGPLQGLRFSVVEGEEHHELGTQLIGQYNVSNLLCVMGALRAMGVALKDAVRACQDLLPVPGRMDCVAEPGQPLVAIDYAHTPDALDKALLALRPLAQQRGGRLWCVFGCGGDRDTGKRPLMAAIAEKNADHVVVTSDNPRSETPGAIIDQVLRGLSQHDVAHAQPDRALAIAETLAQAGAQDVVLIAGKGHEDYQEVAGARHAFSDKSHARLALQRRKVSAARPPEGAKAPLGRSPAASGSGTSSAAREAASVRATSAMMTLQQALAWIPGGRLVGDGATPVQRVHSDTRTLQGGDLFVALKGERFDANDFLADARARGAVAAIAQRGLVEAGLAGIEVADSKQALGMLAASWRAQFKLPLIAVTGSNGKTTVTQMIAAILRAWKGGAAFATQGNLNNDIGVPLTLLGLRAAHEVAVIELGMNHPGEIACLADIARPTVALVNNAQREHQEFMATVQAVAYENGAVIESLAASGVAVFPADEAYTPIWTALAGARPCMSFGTAPGADVSLAGTEWKQGHWQVSVQTPAGPLAYELHIAGRHNVRNSLAAVACTLAAGVPLAAMAQGLSCFEPVKGRSRAFELTLAGRPITVVDDTYNANPDSVRAAIEVLAELPGPRLLVLGDMGEVGDQAPQFHAEVGAHARAKGVQALFTLGAQSARAGASFGAGRHFDDIAALNAAVLAELPRCASVLVKGSRFMKMERVVQAITAHAQQPQQQQKEEGHAA